MSNLLKEAIADAKAVRETALANAKAALEEAFTPRLQSMLSQKLKEDEFGDEEEGAYEEDEDEVAEEGEDEEKPLDVDVEDEGPESGDEGEAEIPDDEGGDEAYDDGDDVEDGEEPVDDDVAVEPESEEEDLDVEAIIRELEAEEGEEEAEEDEGGEEEVAETVEVNGQKYTLVKEEDDEEEVSEEVDQSSGVGNSDEEGYEEESFDDKTPPLKVSEGHDDIVDLSELLDELEGEETEEDDEEVAEEVNKLQSSLKEHRDVIKYLKGKLNEVNLLNAKLLFTNKLFKTYNLNNNQKLRVVETFDRAKNTREIKLIYSTLAESFAGKTSGVKVNKINESFASKPVKSTKPSKKAIINEGSDMAARFKKLAGIN
tara:strand:+ start:749 stop:1864 length:1116 start_codon:yes stop_codon:yes gene_type:complete